MTDEPLLIYVTLAVSVVLVIAQAVPKILGPVGTAAQEWASRRREARIATRSADMVDIQRQLEYLTEQRRRDREEHEAERARDAAETAAIRAEFADHRRMWAAREARWRREYQVHRRWDYRAQEALLGQEPPFDIAPTFMTPDPPEDITSERISHG